MFKLIITVGLLTFAAPAFAQDKHHSGTTYQDKHHSGTTYQDKHHSGTTYQDASEQTASLQLADTPELTQALAAGGEPIVAKVLGAVCDFCAKAMNKTFGKRDDVAAVYVDLDAKTLNLVMSSGASMDDKTLRKLVKKAGYKVEIIARGDILFNG